MGIIKGEIYKGKAIKITGDTTLPPSDNTGSSSPQEPAASVQPSQQREVQLLQMRYQMKEKMKEHQMQSNREREEMALNHENILREQEKLTQFNQ